ncbi:MAG: peptidoglycan editing factor PgeF [Vulcanibacillus sp.]
MEPMVLVNDNLEYFTIPSWTKLNPNLSVGFSTRDGGISKGNFSSMNLALHVEDKNQVVIANRQILCSVINFSFDAWTCAEQVHCNNIEIISEDSRGKGRYSQLDALPKTDGLITNIADILLTSYYADCVPLYFYDPVKSIIGLAHAGWKGTMLKIAQKMVDKFITLYNSNINDIRVVIGPAIGKCCYEVDAMVIEPLRLSMGTLSKDVVTDKGNGKFDLSLKGLNFLILEEAGVISKNIQISSLCTSCNTKLFYSHRKENGKTGRMVSWIAFRKGE